MAKNGKDNRAEVVNEEKTFLVADTFLRALNDLAPTERRAALTALENFRLNPAAPSFRFHRLKQLQQGSNFWSARVNDDLRLIVHKVGSSHMVCYVGHHDDSYAWATSRKIDNHSIDKGSALVLLREQKEGLAAGLKTPEYSTTRNIPDELRQAKEDLEVALEMVAQAESKLLQLEQSQDSGAALAELIAERMNDNTDEHWIAVGPAAKILGTSSRRIMAIIDNEDAWKNRLAISRRERRFGHTSTQETWCIHVESLGDLGNALKKNLAERHLVNKTEAAELFGIAINHPELTSLFDAAKVANKEAKVLSWNGALFHCEERTASNGKGYTTLYISRSDIFQKLPALLGMDIMEPSERDDYLAASDYAPQILHCSFQTAKPAFDVINLGYVPGQGRLYLGNDKSQIIKVKRMTSKSRLFIHKSSADLIRDFLRLPPVKTGEWLTPSEIHLKAGITLQAARRLTTFAEEFWRAARRSCSDTREIKLLFHGNQLTFSERAHAGATGSQRWEKSICLKSESDNDIRTALFAGEKMRNITAASFSGPL